MGEEGRDGGQVEQIGGYAARYPFPEVRMAIGSDEAGLVLAGCAAFIAPRKAPAGVAARQLAEAPALPVRGLMTGEGIAASGDAAPAACARNVAPFARDEPEQKACLVLALRRAGHTIGFIGDSVNDALAMQATDVGLPVAGSTSHGLHGFLSPCVPENLPG